MVICAVQPSETIHSVLKHKLLGRIHRTKIRIVPLGAWIQISWIAFIHI